MTINLIFCSVAIELFCCIFSPSIVCVPEYTSDHKKDIGRYKPDSVPGYPRWRPSILAVYPELTHAMAWTAQATPHSLFDLAPEGVYPAAPTFVDARWALTPPFHPYPAADRLIVRCGAVYFLWHFPYPDISIRISCFDNRTSCLMESGLSSLLFPERPPSADNLRHQLYSLYLSNKTIKSDNVTQLIISPPISVWECLHP